MKIAGLTDYIQQILNQSENDDILKAPEKQVSSF